MQKSFLFPYFLAELKPQLPFNHISFLKRQSYTQPSEIKEKNSDESKLFFKVHPHASSVLNLLSYRKPQLTSALIFSFLGAEVNGIMLSNSQPGVTLDVRLSLDRSDLSLVCVQIADPNLWRAKQSVQGSSTGIT